MTPYRDESPAVVCVHCRERHPRAWTHCPNSGRALYVEDRWLGVTIASNYRIEAVIDRGGMGVVYSARRASGERVAVKCLHPEIAGDEQALKRFRREARVAGATQHPNVVCVLDTGMQSGFPYIVMEHLEGEPLSRRLERKRWISPHVACQLMHQVLQGLGAVHRAGIIHRDLKPANIFLSASVRGEVCAKILDFGVSVCRHADANETKLTRTGVLMGTPTYMSPEQARGNPRFDHRADLYSAAAILYECISGRPPHVRSNYHSLLLAIVEGRPAPLETMGSVLPSGLNDVVHRGLASDPDQRYADADEFARALAPYLTLTHGPTRSAAATAIRPSRNSGVTIARKPQSTSESSVSQTVSMGAMRFLQNEYGPAAVAEVLTRLPSASATLLIQGSPNLRCPTSVCDALLSEAEIEFGSGALSLSRAIGAEIANSAATRTLRWVRSLSTEELVSRLPAVWSDLLDFGKVTVVPVGPTRCRIEVTDTHLDSPARDSVMAGVFARLLTMTGARGADVYVCKGIPRSTTVFRAGWLP